MKMANGYGTVYKLSGKRRKPYIARKTIGWEMINGKLKQKFVTIGYYETRQEGLIALAAYNSNPYDLTKATTSFKEVYEQFIERKAKTVSPATLKSTKSISNKCERFFERTFKDIKYLELQKLVDEYQGSSNAKKIKNFLQQMYDFAIKNEIVPSNLGDSIELEHIAPVYDRKPFTKEEIEMLWQNQDEETIQVILFLMYSGLRIQEALDIKIKDVYLDEKRIYIPASKTFAGIRNIPIHHKLIPFVESWIKDMPPTSNLIRRNKGTLVYTTFVSRWQNIMKRLDMKHTIHETRHTCVTMLDAAKADKLLIKRIVGHSVSDVTDAVYTHKEWQEYIDTIELIQ